MAQSVAARPLVLIMDDEENIRRAMRAYVERHGYAALEADSVERSNSFGNEPYLKSLGKIGNLQSRRHAGFQASMVHRFLWIM